MITPPEHTPFTRPTAMPIAERRTIPDRRQGGNRRAREGRRGGEERPASVPANRPGWDPAPHGEDPDGTEAVTGTISVRSSADRVAITPDGAFAYVQNVDDGVVSLVRTADNTIVSTIRPDDARPEPSISPEPARAAIGPSAESPIDEIRACIRQLVVTGVLKSGWADAFLANLDATAGQLEKGYSTPTARVLHAFAQQVTRFESVGIFTPPQANGLRFAVQRAIRNISA
jgi:hypothetical protein